MTELLEELFAECDFSLGSNNSKSDSEDVLLVNNCLFNTDDDWFQCQGKKGYVLITVKQTHVLVMNVDVLWISYTLQALNHSYMWIN
jgi:hypothetical protein